MKPRAGADKDTDAVLQDIVQHTNASKSVQQDICSASVEHVKLILANESGLQIADSVGMSFAKLICDEVWRCLDKKREEHPEWFLDADYPELFISAMHDCEIEMSKDILGRYFCDDHHIELYWLAIHLACRRHPSWRPDLLSLLVLVHEMAHALCDIGRDADGAAVNCLRAAERPKLSEALAQFWTHCAMGQVGVVESCGGDWSGINLGSVRAIENIYRELLIEQSAAYSGHLAWTDPIRREWVRLGMRSDEYRTYQAFHDRKWPR